MGRRARSLTALSILAALAASCGERAARAEFERASRAAAEARAEAACQLLGTRLLAELTGALGRGTTVDGLEVCARVAQELTAEARSGVKVARTSLRPRNPLNAPDAFERAHLERWNSALARGEPIGPVAEVLPAAQDTSELRYLSPIRTLDLCLRCHGRPADLEPEVRAALERLYPEDQATGYAPGDLRGAFTARVPLGSP